MKVTEYTFEIRRKITVYIKGNKTDYYCEKAEEEAVRLVQKDIETDWLELVDVDEYEEDKEEYKEAV